MVTHLNETFDFKSVNSLVIKVGSALLVDAHSGQARVDWLGSMVADLAQMHAKGARVMVVTSGAVALGRRLLKLPKGVLKLEEKQAAAAVGQIELARLWSEAFGEHGLVAGQVLLTPNDTEDRRNYLNARATIQCLFEMGAVPVVNENDTVATAEIRYGDNDRLAARVATMAGADTLVLFSDVDGLYTKPPQNHPDAQHLSVVEKITSKIEQMAGGVGSELSTGGMSSKIEAGKIATRAGTHMIIADGREQHALRHLIHGGRCTWFKASDGIVAHRKKWISGTIKPKGKIVIDAGAVSALQLGKSLLPAGVKSIEGRFSRGDVIAIVDLSGVEVARGLVAFDVQEALKIVGQKTKDLEALLGYAGRSEMVHRDDMVMAETLGV